VPTIERGDRDVVGTAHPNWKRYVLRRYVLAMIGLGLTSSLSGCVVFDPWQVWRCSVNYNTQRACSAQITVYDHLPPKPARTRLMQWGYNVAPVMSPPTTFAIPANVPIDPFAIPPAPGMDPTPPLQSPDMLDRARPPELPPAATPADAEPRVTAPRGPTAALPPDSISQARSAAGAFLFSAPVKR